MKIRPHIILLVIISTGWGGLFAYTPPDIPYAPAAGQTDTTAIPHDSPEITSWGTNIVSVLYGSEVSEEFRTPAAALGPAGSTSPDVMVLGRGGSVILEFRPGIANKEGWDLAVFENAFRETFLELAYVEVSTDGEHFVRFPNYSLTVDPVGAFGDVQPTFVHGLAGKYRSGFGTPFDLSTLKEAYEASVAGEGGFSSAFSSQLISNFPHLNLNKVNYVRIIDIIGDGSFLDCEGFPIYDPYPTLITAGFDLDAIAVLNLAEVQKISFSAWSQSFGMDLVANLDPDGDKWNNYMEYLLGSNPVRSDSTPDVETSISAEGLFVTRFWVNLTAVVSPQIQISADGVTWLKDTSTDFANPDLTEFRNGVISGRIEARFSGWNETFFLRMVAVP